MRALWVGVLAATLVAAGTPLAAQHPKTRKGASSIGSGDDRPTESLTTMASGRRIWKPCATYNQQALLSSDRLSQYTTQSDPKSDFVIKGNAKSRTQGGLQGEIVALGNALTGEENELNTLDRTATGADKDRLAQVRAHEKEARMHYAELVKAGSNTAAVRRHAAAVHQQLGLAEQSWGGPAATRALLGAAYTRPWIQRGAQ